MDDNKNLNQPSPSKPMVAKIARSNSKPETIGPAKNSETETNIFASVYNQKRNVAPTKAAAATEVTVSKPEQKPASTPVTEKNEAVSTQTVKKSDGTKKSANTDKTKKQNIIFTVLLVVTILVFIAAVVFLISGYFKETDSDNGSTDEIISERNISVESPFSFKHVYSDAYPAGMQEKFKKLYDQNNKIVGWVTVPGTSIDFPVYKSGDNAYYIKADNYDAYNKYGVPFLDMYANVNNLSKNTVVYAHNFGNGLIFDELHNYTDPQFVIDNPVIEYNSIYQDYKWKVIGAFYTNGDVTGDNGYLFYYIATTMGNNSFMEFYDEIQQRSIVHTGVDVQPTDKILTLTTCTYFFDRNGKLENARFAVVARLMREGESEEIDPSLVKLNENVRYPQLYYDVFGGTNPYANAPRWEARND